MCLNLRLWTVILAATTPPHASSQETRQKLGHYQISVFSRTHPPDTKKTPNSIQPRTAYPATLTCTVPGKKLVLERATAFTTRRAKIDELVDNRSENSRKQATTQDVLHSHVGESDYTSSQVTFTISV